MYGTSSCCRTLLLLLLLLVAGDVLRPARAQATLRAPGAPQSDGRIIIGGTAINGKPAFLAQYESIFTDYLNAALGATLGKTFVTVRAGALVACCNPPRMPCSLAERVRARRWPLI
jgi:hypothetical protein